LLHRTGNVVPSADSDGRIPLPGAPLLYDIKAVAFVLMISVVWVLDEDMEDIPQDVTDLV